MATTMLSSEQKSYIWSIPNFAEVEAEDRLTEHGFHLEFEMCDKKRLKWDFHLYTITNRVGMTVSPKNLPSGLSNAHARIQCQIPDKRGGFYFDDELSLSLDTKAADGFAKVVPRTGYSVDRPFLSADGSLETGVTVTVFYHHPASQNSELAALEAEYKDKFAANHRAHLTQLRMDPLNTSTMSTTSCKIVSKDRGVLPADRAILHARSPVFKAMFQSGMSEVQEGVVKLKDIDIKPLNELLHFIHKGQLSKNWKEEGVIEGLIYGAHKYMLEDLKEFLDKALGLLCTEENCGKLAGLAKAFGLKKAEEKLLKYFNENISKSLDDVLRFAEETANAAMLIAPPPKSSEGTGEPTVKKIKMN